MTISVDCVVQKPLATTIASYSNKQKLDGRDVSVGERVSVPLSHRFMSPLTLIGANNLLHFCTWSICVLSEFDPPLWPPFVLILPLINHNLSPGQYLDLEI